MNIAFFDWAFPEIFCKPPVEDNHFQKSYPLEFYLIFYHPPPPLKFHTIFFAPPGIPRKSVILNYDPLEFSNFKHNPLEFSRFSFLRPPWNFRYPQQGGSGKFPEKPYSFVDTKSLHGKQVQI